MKKWTSYLVVFLVVMVAAYVCMPISAETVELRGSYDGANYEVQFDKHQMTLLHNGQVVLETAYRVANRTGLLQILPEKDWFLEDALIEVRLSLQNGMIILCTENSERQKLYYPLCQLPTTEVAGL